jgi:hypothetical protein
MLVYSKVWGPHPQDTRQYVISERDEYNYESKVEDNHLDELSEHSSCGLLIPTSKSSTTSTGTQGSEHDNDRTEVHDNIRMIGEENEDDSLHIAVGDVIHLQVLKDKVEKYAEVCNFKINFETDGAKKYNGKTRLLCRCSSAGVSRSMRKAKTATTSHSDNDEDVDIVQTQFSIGRNRKSLKTACPWRIVAWTATKPVCPDTVLSVTLLINAVHTEELLAEVQHRTTTPNKIPYHVLDQMDSLVCYGVDTRRLRMFIINENLNLATDCQSIVNLKMLFLRAGKSKQLGNRTVESLQTRVTSIWKKDEITSVFAELSRIEKPDGHSFRVRNALEYTRL